MHDVMEVVYQLNSPQHHNDIILVCRLMPSYVMFLNWIHSYLQQIKLWTQTKWMVFCCNSLYSKSTYCAEIRDTVPIQDLLDTQAQSDKAYYLRITNFTLVHGKYVQYAHTKIFAPQISVNVRNTYGLPLLCRFRSSPYHKINAEDKSSCFL